jgi:hypothetical protein
VCVCVCVCVCVMTVHVSVLCMPGLPGPLAILHRLLSPSVLPTSPRLSAQATVGGCHWEVTLTAVGDSLGSRKEMILHPPAQDTPLSAL